MKIRLKSMKNEIWNGLIGVWCIEISAEIVKAQNVKRGRIFGTSFFRIFLDFGRHFGALGIQLGRQVGLKCPFGAENLQKNTKKSIQEGFHKRRGK